MEATNKGVTQYLTFRLGRGIFALDITEVREVLELTDIAAIPSMPEHMRGVINLRGRAVPVMDLSLKMAMKPAERTVNTCIIITEAEVCGERMLMGALVDSVREVFEMSPDEVMPPPSMGSAVSAEFISGMGSQNDEFIVILALDKVLSGSDMSLTRLAMDSTEEIDGKAA